MNALARLVVAPEAGTSSKYVKASSPVHVLARGKHNSH